MEPKLLLIQIITLIYKESLIDSKNYNSAELIRSLIDTIKVPEFTIDRDSNRECIQALRNTSIWMLESFKQETKFDKNSILQRIKINTADEVYLFDAFNIAIANDNLDDGEIKKECRELRHQLLGYLDQFKFTNYIKTLNTKLLFSPEKIDWKTIVNDTVNELSTFHINDNKENKKINGLIGSVDISNFEQTANLFTEAKEQLSDEGMLMTGWQGLNKMLGGIGLRRGEMGVIGAQQHNFKSGFLMNICKHCALYNKPKLFFGDDKKPLLLYISTENNLADQVLAWFYTNLKENESKEPCDVTKVDSGEMAKYIHEKLSINGFHFKIEQYNPSDFTYFDLFDLVNGLEAEGYEIHAIFFDYLNMINKKGCITGPNGVEVRDLFRRVRNFMGPKKIAFITPHQLSSESKNLTRQGVEDFVKEVANKSYWDSCKTLDQEIDLELYVHKVVSNGISYLTVQRGKHRKVKITPEKDLYYVTQFHPIGGILDDINGADTTLKYVGGGPAGSGQEKPFWM